MNEKCTVKDKIKGFWEAHGEKIKTAGFYAGLITAGYFYVKASAPKHYISNVFVESPAKDGTWTLVTSNEKNWA